MFPRRKRNLNVPGVSHQPKESAYGIDWERRKVRQDTDDNGGVNKWEGETEREPGEPDWNLPTKEAKKLLVEEAKDKQHKLNTTSLQKRPDFYEQHKKVTIYIENELMETINRLKKERYIPSYSWLVAEAIQYYLQEKNKS